MFFNTSFFAYYRNYSEERELRRCDDATTANFLKFYFKFIAVSQIQFRDSLDSDKQSK